MRHVRSSRDSDGLYWKVVGRVKYATYRDTQAGVRCCGSLSCGLVLPEHFGRRQRLHISRDEIGPSPSPQGIAVVNDAGIPLEVDQGSRPLAKRRRAAENASLVVGALGGDRHAFAYRVFRWQVLLARHNLV